MPLKDALELALTDSVPDEAIITFPKLKKGEGIFMKGSNVVHRVSSLLSAPTQRITMINSYEPLDPFQPDTATMRSCKDNESGLYEFARHKAWRISQ